LRARGSGGFGDLAGADAAGADEQLLHASADFRAPAGFADSLVVGALDYPIGLAFLPDGRLVFVEQKTTRIRMVRNGALSATDPIVTLPDINTDGSERGLLGIAVDPQWPARPFVYVHANHLPQGTIRISRYQVTGDLTNTGDGTVRMLIVSTNILPAVAVYPDSDKIGVWTEGRRDNIMVRRESRVDYYDGEV